jgi:fermentation-respiration switch protein FrsA (DUF1100 family)
MRLMGLLMGATVKNQAAVIARLRSSSEDVWRSRFQKVNAKALREMLELDPASLYSRVICTTLVIAGAKDVQCEPADAGRIAELARGPVEQHVIPDLTHVLRLDSGEPSMLSVGKLLQEPVAPIVLETIVEWFRRN